jgi:hypothetical protein
MSPAFDVRYGSITDIIRSGIYVCFTPETGHKTRESGHQQFDVRFTPESGHNLNARSCPLLANNSRSAKANV